MLLLRLFLLLILSVGALAAPVDVENIFKDKTTISNPLELRDPFKAPIKRGSDSKNEPTGDPAYSSTNGVYSNLKEADLSNVNVQKMRVMGVLIGKERRVMVQFDTSKDVSILKEGMKLGPDGAELKAILPGGVILVEKIINVYGQEEYLETVIPLSK